MEIGKNATMKCRVVESGTLLDFWWLKWDNLEDVSYKHIGPRYYHSLQLGHEYRSELTIIKVTEDDFGMYSCCAFHHMGEECNSAFLSRYVRPTTPSKRGKKL